MDEHTIATLCTQAGYTVTRVTPYGRCWRVYVNSASGLTYATLDKRFGAGSPLMSMGFGWDREEWNIVVGERGRKGD